jgi:MFS family permease
MQFAHTHHEEHEPYLIINLITQRLEIMLNRNYTLPADIGGSSNYVWIANSFVLASSVFQPLFGQLANIFGRRISFVASTVLFTLGSGIAGGARGQAMPAGVYITLILGWIEAFSDVFWIRCLLALDQSGSRHISTIRFTSGV